MDPASVPLRARRPLRRVLLGGVAGIAWLALSATAANAATSAPGTADAGTTIAITTAPAATTAPAMTTVSTPGTAPSGLAAGGIPWVVVPVPATDPALPPPDPALPALPPPVPALPALPPPDPALPALPPPDPALPALPPPDPALPALPPPAPVIPSILPVTESAPTMPHSSAPVPTLPVIDPALQVDQALSAPGLVIILPADPLAPHLDPGLAGAVPAAAAVPVAKAAVDSESRTDFGAATEPAAIEQPADPFARKLRSGYALVPEPPIDQPGDAQQPSTTPAAAPQASPAPGALDSTTHGGHDDPSPWPGGTGLPAPNALPPAPGSGSGNTHSSNGPSGAVAWIPSLYLIIPTAGDDPIRGPLQHQHSAVSADPGSSPD